MFDPADPHPPAKPNKPRVRDIVAAKRLNEDPDLAKARPKSFRGWHQRGYMPHRDEPGLMQLVTFRLADSVPASLRSRWEVLMEIESDKERRAALESFLDQGHGACWLGRPTIAALAENAIRHFHQTRYDLLAWVIMPNHVHALFKVDTVPMSKIVESWKKFIAVRANRELGRRGPFWQIEYWDTFMRDGAQTQKAQTYIEQNPVKAKLVRDAKDWPWSSARFRDENGF